MASATSNAAASKEKQAKVMVGSFHDYQNKNKPAKVVVNYNSCQMKLPFQNEAGVKSAPNGQLQSHQPNSIKVLFERQKPMAKRATDQVYFASTLNKEALVEAQQRGTLSNHAQSKPVVKNTSHTSCSITNAR